MATVKDSRRRGALRTKSAVVAAGPADEFGSLNTIAPTGTLVQYSNNGTPVGRVHGDGRRWAPILTAAPASPQPGQCWVEEVAGVSYFRFVDHLGAIVSLQDGSPAPPSVTTLPLAVGTTVLDSINVDAEGAARWDVVIADPLLGRRAVYSISVVHDGSTTGDALSAVISIVNGAVVGSPPDVTFGVALSGVGPAQIVQLTANTASTDWVCSLLKSYMTGV